ncbi:peptidoglycan editing factor PgeF [Macrococcoides caseolyticum]|uniref:peptidoglycan editing factor PgeF n=1 Tax=Macrococcoides caseolyticum TaxID=69966 RepID=UPI001F478C8A|nr:peptidoglycan editing factor PgeF [Macrococcus caseolyticus]MCE4956867.1 peptidoglycan editing factor PgeF [Macrococcus caseolyticus]
MEPFQLKQHTFNVQNDYNKVIGITSRHGGISPYNEFSLNMALYIDDEIANVHHNQDIVASEIDFDTTNWVFPIQKHGNRIQLVRPEDKGMNVRALTDQWEDIDGLYTYHKGILLTMCFADCVPVYLFSNSDDFIALGHAGWRGTVGMILERLIHAYDGDKSQLRVIIGPSVSAPCYEVNEDIKSKFIALNLGLEDCFKSNDNQMYAINLQEINRRIAIHAGISPEHITVSKRCTSTENDAFFSYRLEKGKTGRMLAYIGTRDNHERKR